MQVARVARQLATGNSVDSENSESGLSHKDKIAVMALLDGGTSGRQKAWLKAEPPQVVVGTPDRILKMIETKNLRPNTVACLVVDEVDAVTSNTKFSGSGSLKKLLAALSPTAKRQTIFASATIPQHNVFLRECVKNKWTKEDVTHCHVEPEESIPPFISHRYAVCQNEEKLETLFSLIRSDKPRAAIIFVSGQSEKSKKDGGAVPAETVAKFLGQRAKISKESTGQDGKKKETDEKGGEEEFLEPLVLLEEANVNSRAFSVQEFRAGEKKLMVATELAARGLDLPEVSHVYNFDLPRDATSYLHRGGRTGRRPVEREEGVVTNLVTEKEVFALRRIENELRVSSTRVELNSLGKGEI